MTILQLGADDDVVITLDPIIAGATVPLTDGDLVVVDDIPAGHKIAVRDLEPGTPVHKYGHVVGAALAPIHRGQHVHSHNLGMPQDPTSLATGSEAPAEAAQPPADLRRTFAGIVRSDGSVATRNYVAVLTTVNCAATVAKQIARRTEVPLETYADRGVDGIIALTHGTGCGMASSGEGFDVLRRTLTGYAQHPNVGALVVIGLGCEVNAMTSLVDELQLRDDVPIASFTIQESGGTTAAIDRGVREVLAMAEQIADVERTQVGVEHIVLGTQCGGSDSLSAITANPALGIAGDWLVALGATSLLGETPEIYGAEQMLAERAVTPQTKADLLERIAWWEDYSARNGASLDGNPSPGNKAGGITTILEKSLGSVAKGGQAPLAQVVKYAEKPTAKGLVFMDTPGYDPVSATGMIAGGATIICFTTGRGSAFGSRPAPTVKLATNATLAQRMSGDMDLDCSTIVETGESHEAVARRIYDLLLDTASGKKSLSEALGLGAEEFVPWQIGAVL